MSVYILLCYSCSDKPRRHWECKTFLWASCGTGQVSLNHGCQSFDRVPLPPSPGLLCVLCPAVCFDPKWFAIGKHFYSCSCASHCFKTTFSLVKFRSALKNEREILFQSSQSWFLFCCLVSESVVMSLDSRPPSREYLCTAEQIW